MCRLRWSTAVTSPNRRVRSNVSIAHGPTVDRSSAEDGATPFVGGCINSLKLSVFRKRDGGIFTISQFCQPNQKLRRTRYDPAADSPASSDALSTEVDVRSFIILSSAAAAWERGPRRR